MIEQRTQKSLEGAISAFARTTAADESHAGAHAGIAEANALAAEYLFVEPHAAFRRARTYSQRALDLDPDNVEAHVTLGNVHLFYDWDFVAAYEALERATWLDPAHSSSRLDKARFLGIVGNYEAAVSEIASVLAREPFSLRAMSVLASVAILHDDFETVREMADAALSLDPSHALMQYYLISGLALSGRYREAIDLFDSKSAHPYRQQSLAVAAFAAARAGLRSRANELTAEIDDASNWPYLSAFNRALPRIGLNELENAIALVRAGIQDRDPWSVFILRHPIFAEIPGIEELRHAIGPVPR